MRDIMDRAEMLKQFLEQNPNDAFARYGLAMEYSRAGEIEIALAEFRKLLELHPDYTAAYQMAGQMLAAAGDGEGERRRAAWTKCAGRAVRRRLSWEGSSPHGVPLLAAPDGPVAARMAARSRHRSSSSGPTIRGCDARACENLR